MIVSKEVSVSEYIKSALRGCSEETKSVLMDIQTLMNGETTPVRQYNFDRPIAWFNIETTGLNPAKHRIIKLEMIVVSQNKETVYSFKHFINPYDGNKFEVSAPAMEANKIDLNELNFLETFESLSEEIRSVIEANDLGGFNISNFILPFILEEFYRIGKPLKISTTKNVIDSHKILNKFEPRTIKGLLEKYFLNPEKTAHSIHRLSSAIVAECVPSGKCNDELSAECREDMFDFNGSFRMIKTENIKKLVFNFGKYRDVEFNVVFDTDRRYLEWLATDESTPLQTKDLIRRLIQIRKPEKK